MPWVGLMSSQLIPPDWTAVRAAVTHAAQAAAVAAAGWLGLALSLPGSGQADFFTDGADVAGPDAAAVDAAVPDAAVPDAAVPDAVPAPDAGAFVDPVADVGELADALGTTGPMSAGEGVVAAAGADVTLAALVAPVELWLAETGARTTARSPWPETDVGTGDVGTSVVGAPVAALLPFRAGADFVLEAAAADAGALDWVVPGLLPGVTAPGAAGPDPGGRVAPVPVAAVPVAVDAEAAAARSAV